MRRRTRWGLWCAAALLSAGAVAGGQDPPADPAQARPATADEVGAPEPAPAAGATDVPVADPAPGPAEEPAAAPLLQQAPGGDGDSWRDTAGAEYRLGLVNAPEVGACFGAEATARRQSLLAAGFRARPYTQDRYGRQVAEIRTADGRELALELARSGHVDDRFLEQFAHENPALADRLRPLFAAARAAGAGLWGACGTSRPEQHPPAAEGCHPDYVTCVPVQGDGSGRGSANDLDCGDVDGPVQVRRPGDDPYRFDADGDGTGCDGGR